MAGTAWLAEVGTLRVPAGAKALARSSRPWPYTGSTPGSPRSSAVLNRICSASCGERVGKDCSNSARAPATTGPENEVPDTSQQLWLLQPVITSSPGATRKPAAATPALLEKLDRVLVLSVEPTAATKPAYLGSTE